MMKTAIFLTSLLSMLALNGAVPAEKPSNIFDALMQYQFLNPALKETSNEEDTLNNLVMNEVLLRSILDVERNRVLVQEIADQFANQNSFNIFDYYTKCVHSCLHQE